MFTLGGHANLNDPMKPPWLKYKKKPEVKKEKIKESKEYQELFNLTQIVANSTGKRVVINGYVLRKGQYINNAEIKSIKENEVILVRGQKKWILKLTDDISEVRK